MDRSNKKNILKTSINIKQTLGLRPEAYNTSLEYMVSFQVLKPSLI